MVGPLPPPVHGFSQATIGIARLFEEAGYSVTRIDMKPAQDRGALWGLFRLRLRQMAQVVKDIRAGADLYLALSGGRRQAIDLLFLFLGKVFNAKIYIHHHSFAYLMGKSLLANLCFRLCGSSATHLVLCPSMDRALGKHYGAVKRTEVLSNSALMEAGSSFRQRTKVKTIGFLGALTVDKGIYEFLQVASDLAPEYPELQFRVAGPCTDHGIRARVESACQGYSNLKYVGPVYGEAKKEYLESIDVLLFPSTYRNEAEPFVIWEAQSGGIPVIASERGCMEHMLRIEGEPPLVVPSGQSFVDVTIETIRKWLSDPNSFARRSTDVNRSFVAASIEGRRQFEEVFCSPLESLRASNLKRPRTPHLVQIGAHKVDPPTPRPIAEGVSKSSPESVTY